jgi:WD40 repeat protein
MKTGETRDGIPSGLKSENKDGRTADNDEWELIVSEQMAYLLDCSVPRFNKIGKPPDNIQLRNLSTSHNHRFFAGMSEKGEALVFNDRFTLIARIKTLATDISGGDWTRALAVASDGKTIAVGTMKGNVFLYDIVSGTFIGTYLYFEGGDWVWFTPEGMITGTESGKAMILPPTAAEGRREEETPL